MFNLRATIMKYSIQPMTNANGKRRSRCHCLLDLSKFFLYR